jgi:hypothetical protein
MPCLNEAETLSFYLARTKAWIETRGIDAEIVVADNPILPFIGRVLFKCPAKDFHCGLRTFKK